MSLPSFLTVLLIYQGELEHRWVKRFYARTNKCITFTQQIAKQERRQRLLRQIMGRLNRRKINLQPTVVPPDFEHIRSPAPSVLFEESDSLPKTSPELRYHTSNTTHLKDNIFCWVDFHDQNGDEAVKVYHPEPIPIDELLKIFRILSPILKITSFLDCWDVRMMVMKPNIPKTTVTRSNLLGIHSTGTRCYVLIIQPMISAANNLIPSTRGLIQTLC